MPSALVVGYDPQEIPGVDAQALRAGLDAEPARFGEHGIDAAMTLVEFDESAEPALVTSLTARPEVVNLIRRHAPQAAVAFNTSGGDSVEAARRWL